MVVVLQRRRRHRRPQEIDRRWRVRSIAAVNELLEPLDRIVFAINQVRLIFECRLWHVHAWRQHARCSRHVVDDGRRAGSLLRVVVEARRHQAFEMRFAGGRNLNMIARFDVLLIGIIFITHVRCKTRTSDLRRLPCCSDRGTGSRQASRFRTRERRKTKCRIHGRRFRPERFSTLIECQHAIYH